MKQVTGYPPNIEEIRQVFPLKPGTIFAWGDTIFNPSGDKLPSWLIAHEQVHQRQQDGDPETWWARYLIDPKWRFEQELEAHRAEYNMFSLSVLGNRNKKRAFLKSLARRLSSPMYGNIRTYQQCRVLIKKGNYGR